MGYPQMVLKCLLQKEAMFCVRAPGRSGRAAAKASHIKTKARQRRRVITQGRLQLKSKAEFGVRRLKDKTETGPES